MANSDPVKCFWRRRFGFAAALACALVLAGTPAWAQEATIFGQVTDASGAFKISDLPPGEYDVEVWHEKLGKKAEKISVKAKEETKVDWKLGKS